MVEENEFAEDAVIADVVARLCQPDSYASVAHRTNHDVPMPSVHVLREIVDLLKSVLFPGYFGASELKPETMKYHVGAAVEKVSRQLAQQIERGFCFDCTHDECLDHQKCRKLAAGITAQFLARLPVVRELLATDVRAGFESDPAAKSPGETIFCYPSINAMVHFRVAHELHALKVPIIPRIITELAHSATGIDIHPGATIGERFFMDHGTGIVIGETTIIGRNVHLFQGVTLGAKSFPVDEEGKPIKGIPRHPIIEDDVIIYAGATVLGRITIGKGAVIGGNVWLTRDVPPGKRILQGRVTETSFEQGAGI